jgi:hypothetical protein
VQQKGSQQATNCYQLLPKGHSHDALKEFDLHLGSLGALILLLEDPQMIDSPPRGVVVLGGGSLVMDGVLIEYGVLATGGVEIEFATVGFGVPFGGGYVCEFDVLSVGHVVIIIQQMKKTIKDLEKMSDSSMKWLKWGLYYVYLPVVVVVGIRTIRWENFSGAAPPM